MRRAAMLGLLLTGCAGPFGQHMTGHAIRMQPSDTYPHEVDYELLTTATGKACGTEDSTAVKHGKSSDPSVNGPPALFEQAKFVAVGSVQGADGLAAIRSFVEEVNGNLCVSVMGRAYRITKIKAVAGHSERTADRLLEPKE